MKLGRPVSFSATTAPGLAVLLFHVNPAALKTAGSPGPVAGVATTEEVPDVLPRRSNVLD
jgi:hypothetical protein